MTIETRRQLENTRAKLQELEQLYAQTAQAPSADEHVRQLTLRSLRQRINRFKEEICTVRGAPCSWRAEELRRPASGSGPQDTSRQEVAGDGSGE